MEKTTLKDISNYTNLSVSTVSRILRGESNAESKNVQQVIDAAQTLGYPLNTGYLNSKYNFKKHIHVALVTNFEPAEFYSSFFNGLRESALEENISLSLYDYHPSSGPITPFIKNLIDLQTDAAILFLPFLKEEEYSELLKNIPSSYCIVSVLPLLHPLLDTITFDSYGGGHLIAQHFYEKGYRNVGIVNGPYDRYEALLRKNGFTDYVTHKDDMKLTWSFGGEYHFEDGQKAFDEFAKLANKPEAIFLANDAMCIGFLNKAYRAGIKVPEDVAIAGYDDLNSCKFYHPSLTSVRTDYQKLGQKAFKVLKDKLTTSEVHSGLQSIIPVTLSKREST